MKSGRLDFQAPFDNVSEAEGALTNANTGKLRTSRLLILLKLAEQSRKMGVFFLFITPRLHKCITLPYCHFAWAITADISPENLLSFQSGYISLILKISWIFTSFKLY